MAQRLCLYEDEDEDEDDKEEGRTLFVCISTLLKTSLSSSGISINLMMLGGRRLLLLLQHLPQQAAAEQQL